MEYKHYRNGELCLRILPSELLAEVQSELNQLQGRVHDTEFNKVDISSLCFNLINNGGQVTGNWSIKHRERLFRNPFSGGMVHTDWVCMSGYFRQDFRLAIRNGNLIVEATSNHVSSSDWYGFIVDLLVSWFNANGKIRSAVNHALRAFNGANLTSTLMQFKAEIARKSGLPTHTVESILSSTNSLNAEVSPSGLTFRIVVPKNFLTTI